MKKLTKLFTFLNERKPLEQTALSERFLQLFYVYALIALAVSLKASLAFQNRIASRDFERYAKTKMQELVEQKKNAVICEGEMLQQTKKMALGFAYAVADAIALDPDLLEEPVDEVEAQRAGLGKLAKDLGVDEISVVGEEGFVIASYPKINLGTDFHNPTLNEFLQLMNGRQVPVAQPIRLSANAPQNGAFMYVGVKRLDKPGVVQLGLSAQPLERLNDAVKIENFLPNLNDKDNPVAIFKGSEVVAGSPSFANSDLLKRLNSEFHEDFLQGDFKLNDSRAAVSETTFDYLLKNGRRGYEIYRVYGTKQGSDGYTYACGMSLSHSLRKRMLVIFLTAAVMFCLFLSVFFSASYLLKKFVAKSIYRINKSLEIITEGNLDEKVDARTSKEFSDLSDGVNQTVDALKRAIASIKTRADEELELAQKIQAAALPNVGVQFSRDSRFKAFAVNRPMRKVGGDMYDFFFVDEKTIMFYVADVSGHGVPAALVMMKTMALVKNLALSGQEIARVVSTTNERLTENNESMFVTGFFCRVDLTTGVVTYVNAGHNPPFIRRCGKSFEQIDPEINLILGIQPTERYHSAEIQLNKGDELILYTDGITEATAPGRDCFETQRALDALNAASEDDPVEKLATLLFNKIQEFTQSAEPSDDETLLVFKLVKFDR